MPSSASLAKLLAKYPFKRHDDYSHLKGIHGIYLVIGCRPCDKGETECTLLDFGGTVDVGHAIDSSFQKSNWRATYGVDLSILVAEVSLMECESLLRELHQIQLSHTP